MAPGQISIRYGFRVPNTCNAVSACASSSKRIIDALNYIRLGHADIMVSGGSEAHRIHPLRDIGGSHQNALHATRLRSLTTLQDLLTKTEMVLFREKGAGALILEEYEHAIARGAKIYAEMRAGRLICRCLFTSLRSTSRKD